MAKSFACLLLVFCAASCAHPLESEMDRLHQANVDASNPTDQPLSNGAGDGLGKTVAHQTPDLTMNDRK